MDEKILGRCAVVLAVALVFRLLAVDAAAPLAALLQRPGTVSALMFLQTGRSIRLGGAEKPVTEPTAQTLPAQETEAPTQPVAAVFAGEDVRQIEMINQGTWEPDLEALLLQPVSLPLTGGEPKVLIVHTHTTESYTKLPEQDYEESSAWRTLDGDYNMLRVGDALASLLEQAGIGVLHDRTLHDYPSYNGSYSSSRKAVRQYLQEYPSVSLVLDLHRDAADTSKGDQLATQCFWQQRDTAQLMLVMGTGENGQSHPQWQRNLSLALKLQLQLERICPGITRPLVLRGARYNQDLHHNMLLVEVGAAGDTLEQALNAVEPLAQAIISLADMNSP